MPFPISKSLLQPLATVDQVPDVEVVPAPDAGVAPDVAAPDAGVAPDVPAAAVPVAGEENVGTQHRLQSLTLEYGRYLLEIDCLTLERDSARRMLVGWEAIGQNLIDLFGPDHLPFPIPDIPVVPEDNEGDEVGDDVGERGTWCIHLKYQQLLLECSALV